MINRIYTSIDNDASNANKSSRLSEKLEETDNTEPQTWPLRNTLGTIDVTEVMIRSLSKLIYAKDELKNFRRSLERVLKER